MPEPVLEGQDTYPEPGVWTTIVGLRSTSYLQRGQTITVRWSSFWESMTELGYTRPVDDGEFPDVDSRFPDVAEVMRMIAVGATTLPGQRILDVRGTNTGLVVTVGTDLEHSREHAVAWPVMTELIDHVTQMRDQTEVYATDAGGALDAAVVDLRAELAQLNGIASAAAQVALDAAESISTGDAAQGLSAYQVAVANGFTGTEVQWLASLQGPQGPQGIPGPQGERGPQGLQGPQGVKGDKGDQGVQGPQGLQGPQGPKGDKGDQGPQGEDGRSVSVTGTVDTAAQLPTNLGTTDSGTGYITADDGHLHVWSGTSWTDVGTVRGPQGPQGPQGIQGPQGPAGADGAQGPQGLQGVPGEDGADGAQGPEGPKGPKGDKGDQGVPGQQGPAGASAYQVAVSNGFTGTQAEWLASLVGPKGERGLQGIQGIQGPKGDKGDKGDTGPAGTTTWAGITDKPTTFTPATHTHTTAQVSGLDTTLANIQTALDGKKFKVVAALPTSPDPTTIYFVTG